MLRSERILRSPDSNEGDWASFSKNLSPGTLRFHPGSLFATPGVIARVTQEELVVALNRHLAGDWGELDEHDRKANETALKEGTRLLSAYFAANGEKFWIITEADRSSTTSLLPEEY